MSCITNVAHLDQRHCPHSDSAYSVWWKVIRLHVLKIVQLAAREANASLLRLQ